MWGTTEQQIAIFCGAKYPRKLKKLIYGTKRQRRKFTLDFIRLPKKIVNITLHKFDLEVTNAR